MSIDQFEQFKDFLATAVQDTDFVRKNTVLQDSAYMQTLLDRLEAITSDVSLEQDYSDFESGLGLLLQDTANSNVAFDTKGFEILLSAFREGTISVPRRIFRRATVADDIYYLLADGGIASATGKGVLLLNSNMEVVRRFPGFGTTSTEYEDPSDVITFTIASVEYVAISDFTHEVVQIYLYESPYTLIATIGTFDTPGAAADLLTTPNGVAVDETNELMYISCPTGQPSGATASNGFIAIYDISTIGTPVFDSIPFFYSGTGSLLDAQVYEPTDITFNNSLLWISNHGPTHTDPDGDVGGFDMTDLTAPTCTRYIEAAGAGYNLRGPQQLYFRTTTGGFERLYVTDCDTGCVHEFDALTLQHLMSYGIRATEDNGEVDRYMRLSDSVYGALGHPCGVVVDTVSIDGQDTNVMLVTETDNKRVQRFNLDAYTEDNFVNFAPVTYDVPVIFDSWQVSGNLPLDMITVLYRFNQTEEFREMPLEATLASTRTIQFRIRVKLDTRKFIHSDWYIKKLRIHGRHA